MRNISIRVLGVAVGVALVANMLAAPAALGGGHVFAKLVLNRSSATLEVGQSFQLRIKSGGSSATAKYRSSDPKIATVTSGGVVKVKKKGQAVITVSCSLDSSVSASFKVVGKNAGKKPTKIALKDTKKTLSVGGTYLAALKSVKPSSGSKIVKWSSSNKQVASVNINGEVTALKAGTATITAISAKNKKAKASLKVSVKAATGGAGGTGGDQPSAEEPQAVASSITCNTYFRNLPNGGPDYAEISCNISYSTPGKTAITERISTTYSGFVGEPWNATRTANYTTSTSRHHSVKIYAVNYSGWTDRSSVPGVVANPNFKPTKYTITTGGMSRTIDIAWKAALFDDPRASVRDQLGG